MGFNAHGSGRINNLACTGLEDSLLECHYTTGSCKNYSLIAAVLCTRNVTSGLNFTLSAEYYGEVLATRYGVRGHVCRQGWDDVDAAVMCSQAGFQTGVALGVKLFGRYQPVWASKIQCTGHEASLSQCPYQLSMATDWRCASDLSPAGALCYNNRLPDSLVRMQDGKSQGQGRVEVYHDITGWGTVCNDGWTTADAAVFCRQLGFADGQAHPSAYTSPAGDQMKVLLSNLECTGKEGSILQCPSNGWMQAGLHCNHNTDAGVFCYTHVRLSPGPFYGTVQFHSGERYGLVCSDGFDTKAATVMCRQQGLHYGMQLCCSGFGLSQLPFTMSDVRCLGSETELRQCMYSSGNVTCASRQYAAVVCYDYDIGYTKVTASPIVKITYQAHEGYVCTEGFTFQDAQVLCRQQGFMYGTYFKASATGLEQKIRWLRGLNCSGNETDVRQCGPNPWGQIGICMWDAVAAVRCSSTADLETGVRLVNGSQVAGRVEVKVDGSWGSLCGLDLTVAEARVICRELGFHEGRIMSPGYYGAGTGNVIFTALKCQGTESSFGQCVWSGYRQGSSLTCDHSKDAAVTCFYNVRLRGSVVPNYGRLEMFDSQTSTWLSVCDSNFNTYNAKYICQQMGYIDGLIQRGSPLGISDTPLSIKEVNCGNRTECTFTKGECLSSRYMALYCSEKSIGNEDLRVRLPLSSFYGPVSVQRFGLWGHVCSSGFRNESALVACRELGYTSGVAVHTYQTQAYPIIQGAVKCTGKENTLSECARGNFADDHGCFSINTVAAVICSNQGSVHFGKVKLNYETGRMSTNVEIIADDNRIYVSSHQFSDVDAAVYCRGIGYAGGISYKPGEGVYGVTDVDCKGTEGSLLECPGVWDPEKTKGIQADLAGTTCLTAVRLVGGDPSFYGAVLVTDGTRQGLVCADNFYENDAGVVCKELGYERGLVLCCSPFGVLDYAAIWSDVNCTGTENHFTDCRYNKVSEGQGQMCQRNYAAVVCSTGTVPTDYTLSLPSADSYIGHLTVTYLGIQGSVCFDGWGDREANVACQELGYSRGIAYNAVRTKSGPYWMSNISCIGNETRLTHCRMNYLGKVRGCQSLQSHAGVICYNNDGVFYRLGGSNETRYGRVEVSMAGDWRSLCSLHWDDIEAHVLCRMLEFQTGQAYQGRFVPALTGAVWEANIDCLGGESSLSQCRSSGWVAATTSACARHEMDAGAFCYTSVRLSTGVGRETNKGAVLLYDRDQWNLVCADGFNDTSAGVVCRELGFLDGHAECCNQYGMLEYSLLTTHKVMCSGGEKDVRDCLKPQQCHNMDYASVVCYGFSLLKSTEAPSSKQIQQGFNALPVIIAVIVFVILISIAVTVFCIYRRHRRNKKQDDSKLKFDNTIVQEHMDSSLHASNPLHGVPTPEVVRASYSRRGNTEVANVIHGVNNPAYERFDQPAIHITPDHMKEEMMNKCVNHNTRTSEVPFSHYDKLRQSEIRDYVVLSHPSYEANNDQHVSPETSNHERCTNDLSDTSGYEQIRDSRMIRFTKSADTGSGDQTRGTTLGGDQTRGTTLGGDQTRGTTLDGDQTSGTTYYGNQKKGTTDGGDLKREATHGITEFSDYGNHNLTLSEQTNVLSPTSSVT
ncbi:scavenger receptor cysteine-rich type 1 protein M130-like isoform X2 [Dreissena polymorpha]|uniref:scavenger receptor cysteine-rich type 1 protein M130-like isoform X2 n=1 Tax=Dreissena polymorpha TaxID=45954 RepID=UPI0022645ED0|nr:scavenger receptor cysteine-rich type 1 protein M130-like isoform X2 [Dreissena polymorpha]